MRDKESWTDEMGLGQLWIMCGGVNWGGPCPSGFDLNGRNSKGN